MRARTINSYKRALGGLLGLILAAPIAAQAGELEVALGDVGHRRNLERALAIELGASERDAVVFRMADGDGMAIFAPLADGQFELRIYAGMGPHVDAIVEADVNGDDLRDLVAVRGDGTFTPWLMHESRELRPEPFMLASPHDGHGAGAHAARGHAAANVQAHCDASPAPPNPRIQEAIEAGRTTQVDRIARPDAPHARPDRTRSVATTPAADSVSAQAVWVTSDGRVLVRTDLVGNDEPTHVGPLPYGFRPRLVAFGRFGDNGEPAIAIVGEGARPRLVLVAPRAGGSPNGAADFGGGFDVRESFVPTATFPVTVGSGGTVFTPDPVNILVGDTVQWTWASSNHTVTSGSECTADGLFCSPSNTNCATAPVSGIGAVYSRVFGAAGSFPYFCNPHCVFGMTGTVNVSAPASPPGAVPDADEVPGVPLRVAEGAGGTLDLSWGSSCSAGATNYAIYQGSLPIVAGTYTHAALNCSAGTSGTANVVPGPGNRYYLVVPRNATNEGSYGLDWIGGVHHQIPSLAGACQSQSLSPCP